MKHLLLPVLALALTGCPKNETIETPLTTTQLADSPRLPAPQAGSYARVPKTPKDPAVRAVIGERTWDESLAGAAAGLALNATQDQGGFTRREMREAAWQAGYPWPVLAMGTWPTSEGAAPPQALVAWTREQPASRDLGLVRARGQGRDLWVGLSGQSLIGLGVIAREVASGTSVTLPAHPGARYRISDGNGAFIQGDLDSEYIITFNVPGEWLIQIVDDGGDLARFPVYVDEEAPELPVLPPHNINIDSKQAASDRVNYLMQTARKEYRNKPFFLDPLLNAAASNARDAAPIRSRSPPVWRVRAASASARPARPARSRTASTRSSGIRAPGSLRRQQGLVRRSRGRLESERRRDLGAGDPPGVGL